MAAIVDVYDAITSDRCYHRAMLPFEALRKLFEWSEFHFDRKLTQHFVRCMGIYPVGTLVRLESGLLGVVLEQGGDNLLQPTVRIVYDTRKKKYISPYDVNLSCPSHKGGSDKIADYEQPERWNIRPEGYLLEHRACLI